ncbi:MAG TPA: hypothetical protein HA222_04460, partial [Candidatus Diapherotrites archaeon]|nr:hypothetical protein [Candidatus Diapherotrites archaeon]
IEILKEIDEGKFDNLISSGKTEPSEEKKKQLAEVAKDLSAKVKEREKQKAGLRLLTNQKGF